MSAAIQTSIPARADTTCPEDWEADFYFDAPAGETSRPLFPTQPHNRSGAMAGGRDGSSTNSGVPGPAISITERRELEKLLSTLPDLFFDEQMLEEPHARDAKEKLALKDLIRDIQASSRSLDVNVELCIGVGKRQLSGFQILWSVVAVGAVTG